jgi:alpha-D-glucose phosphate-specific phosphoglucomutase
MNKEIKFGTDGWRAIIAEEFTFDNVRACAQGVADYLKANNVASPGLVIGNDTRFASEYFAAACAEVISANGIKVLLCSQPTPTPVISYAVTNTKSAGAIIITASHNPGIWNGFKYKDSTGASAPTDMISQIEKYTNQALLSGKINKHTFDQGLNSGLIKSYDARPDYAAHLQNLIDLAPIKKEKMNIMVDSMYGAGIGYFKYFLASSNININEIHGERNPLFPGLQPEPIAKNLTQLCTMMKEKTSSIGLATDGDSDRIGIVTEQGKFLNPLEVFTLLALYFIEIKGERRPIVRSLCSSNMLDILGKMYNIPVYITKVGFKYVAPVMLETDAFIGGEESGGYGFRGHVPERDGVLAGIYFLDYMVKTGKTPSQLIEHLFSKVGPHYYDRYDFHIKAADHRKILDTMGNKTIDTVAGIKVTKLDKTDGFKFNLADNSWLLIRFSGTEPLIRIYAESHSPDFVKKILDSGVATIGL